MKIIVAFLLLVAVLLSGTAATVDLTGPQGVVVGFSRGLDNIVNKYGNFWSPLSWSSGAAKTLNLTVTGNFFLGGTNFGLIVPDVTALLLQYATSTISYIENDSFNGVGFTVAVSGLPAVAVGLVELGLLAGKEYSQRTLYGAGPVSISGFGSQVNLTYTDRVTGLAATPACVANPLCYAGSDSDPNLNYFELTGTTTYVLVFQVGQGYKIAAIDSTSGITTQQSVVGLVPPGSTNFAPW